MVSLDLIVGQHQPLGYTVYTADIVVAHPFQTADA